MKWIKKGTEPKSLKNYRLEIKKHHSVGEVNFDNIPDKETLKLSLLEEQGYLCCYCLGRISADHKKMKVEHWHSQSKYPEEQLDYKNLLAACIGGEGNRKGLQYCDTRKGNAEIKINPTSPDCEKLVRYGSDGSVYSDNTKINEDLNDKLNLNQEQLVKNRKNVWNATIDALGRSYSGKSFAKITLQNEIKRWEEKNEEGKYREYCQVVIDLLKKKLERITNR